MSRYPGFEGRAVTDYLMKFKGKSRPPSWATTEKKFQAEVCKIATQLGWTWYHTWNSFHSAAGFPDLVLVRPPRLVFAELKTEQGKLTPEQIKWIQYLGLVEGKVSAHSWKPSDIETIIEVLR